MSHRRRRFIAGVVAIAAGPVFALGAAPAAFAATSPGPQPIPDEILSDTYETPVPLGVSSGLKGAEGAVEVTVRLAEPAIAEVVPEGAVAESTVPSKSAQRGKTAKVEAQQESFVSSARKLGAKKLGSTQLAANLVVIEVDASKLAARPSTLHPAAASPPTWTSGTSTAARSTQSCSLPAGSAQRRAITRGRYSVIQMR